MFSSLTWVVHICSLLSLLSLFSIQVLAAPTLKTVIGENMSAPWLIADSSAKPQGLTADYLQALSKELGREMEILILPKFRILEYYQKKKIDLNCYTSPEWARLSDNEVSWSEPLFTSKNTIASNTTPPKSLEDIKGQRIGTVLKYSYPAIQNRFSSGELIRDDSSNEDANLQKLDASRFNYAVAEQVHLAYYLKHHKKSKINKHVLTIEEVPVRCWLRHDAPINISELNRAITTIKSNGTLDRIFRKYR